MNSTSVITVTSFNQNIPIFIEKSKRNRIDLPIDVPMGSPEYPEDPNEFKPPSTNSLPMHGFDEQSDSDENESPNDRIASIDPYAGYQQLNLEDLGDGDDIEDEDEDSTNVQVFLLSFVTKVRQKSQIYHLGNSYHEPKPYC